jgi:hypothetical protein
MEQFTQDSPEAMSVRACMEILGSSSFLPSTEYALFLEGWELRTPILKQLHALAGKPLNQAAPDLLYAAQVALGHLEAHHRRGTMPPGTARTCERLRSAIAKATTGELAPPRTTVTCLCGSTRFSEAFQRANLEETLAGRIVLSIGCDTKSDQGLGLGPEVKAQLDALHLRKIDMADEILVLNVGGYIGESTSREVAYAQGKRVRYLEPLPEPEPA